MYMHLQRGELLTLDITHSGIGIRCSSGRVWVTMEGDTRDYVLGAGQQLELRERGRMAITALEESTCLPETLRGGLPVLQFSTH